MIAIPRAPTPLGRYVPLIATGDLVFLSGMVPIVEGQPRFQGVIGATLTAEQGAEAARTAALNAIAVLREGLGSLDAVAGIVRLTVSLRAAPDFVDLPGVADGASAIFDEIFGTPHTRLVVGLATLPAGMCVELEVIARRA